MNPVNGPVKFSHLLMDQFVREGDAVIDATCGNGSDTAYLAGLVGVSGSIWAFDIQQEAIDRAQERLLRECPSASVTFFNTGHETMKETVASPVRAVVFNLGYLPGGDHSCTTKPETTLKGLEQAAALIVPGGIIAVTLYPGHEGGNEETCCVESWASGLPQRKFHVWKIAQMNTSAYAPRLIFIQKARCA